MWMTPGGFFSLLGMLILRKNVGDFSLFGDERWDPRLFYIIHTGLL